MSDRARYSIGIDLGTTNCALAYVDLASNAKSQVLSIRQRDTANTEIERNVLPSFLYLEERGDWEAGLFAREKGREIPDRVIHSAKSWLCHHSVDPEAKILPWKSELVAADDKLSPIAASARLLRFLKDAWESRWGAVAPFVEQAISITVPASFDAAAQAVTLEAAKKAGYPDGVRLLEEPQAAFYRWLEGAGEAIESLRAGETILVVDIGGGTSDFSLFRVGALRDGFPQIERVSVSDHLLLGGDNIDLALAHALESELAPQGEELSVDQWGHLIGRARELKEACLSEGADEERSLAVSLPSRGAGLFAGTLSTEVSSKQARELVLEGFFPMCAVGAVAERQVGGLRELGLPYAADCAVTRHLAEFLGKSTRVDRVLFNGGSLSSSLVAERLLTQLGDWQSGSAPSVLPNGETDLAVARGAAYYGAFMQRGIRRIDSGAPRAIFLEVAANNKEADARLFCVLPKGAQPGEEFTLEIPGLRLAVNRRAQFRVFQGAGNIDVAAGEWLGEGRESCGELPGLEAMIEIDGEESIPVRLRSGVNELSLLTVSCESIDEDRAGSWPLEFDLRADFSVPARELPEELNFDAAKVDRAGREMLGRLRSRGASLKASRIFKELEKVLGCAKHEWSIGLCRALAEKAFAAKPVIAKSAEAAECWLQLVGYLLRPGFGSGKDAEFRQKVFAAIQDLSSPPAKVEVQRLIMLRRLSAGFLEAEQESLFDEQFELLENSNRSEAERVRLLASLESVDLDRKERFRVLLVSRLEERMARESAVSPLLAGLGILLSRVLFSAGEDRVVPPARVVGLFDLLKKEDWSSGRFSQAAPLFLKAARRVDDRSLNVAGGKLQKIIAKLKKSGVADNKLLALRDYVPVSREDWLSSYGESLPPGLLLESENV